MNSTPCSSYPPSGTPLSLDEYIQGAGVGRGLIVLMRSWDSKESAENTYNMWGPLGDLDQWMDNTSYDYSNYPRQHVLNEAMDKGFDTIRHQHLNEHNRYCVHLYPLKEAISS